MKKEGKRYLFNNATDMISLAQEIQSNVYWGNRCTEIKSEESFPYSDLWYRIGSAYEDGYIGISINEDNEIAFLVM